MHFCYLQIYEDYVNHWKTLTNAILQVRHIEARALALGHKIQ